MEAGPNCNADYKMLDLMKNGVFVGIAENGVRHCFRVVKSATSSTCLNRISASFAKHIHTINLHFCARKYDERAFFENVVGC